MLLSTLAGIVTLLVSITREDVEQAWIGRQWQDARVQDAALQDTRTPGTVPGRWFCESDGTPISLALHRMGYRVNVADDYGILVGHTEEDARWYAYTSIGQSVQEAVCMEGRLPKPLTLVLVAGELGEGE